MALVELDSGKTRPLFFISDQVGERMSDRVRVIYRYPQLLYRISGVPDLSHDRTTDSDFQSLENRSS